MTASTHKIVWILGAGASVGLGGPTLESLLSRASKLDLEARYDQSAYPRLFDEPSSTARRLYHHGRRWPEGPIHLTHDAKKPGELLWRHAEQFLDYLDTAAADGNSALAKRLRLTLDTYLSASSQPLSNNISIAALSAAAKRLIAAECCAFLEDPAVKSERWAPYVRWANGLGQNDTVVTFNYDRVLETIEAQFLMAIATKDELHEATAAKCCPIFKLHGSVDWRRRGTTLERTGDPRCALTCGDDELAIATPGPTKGQNANSDAFRPLWNAALERIELADAVVFVGYRFPPTDSIARERILGRIRENKRPEFRVHIVLGQDRPAEGRLTGMLRFVRWVRQSSTTVHAMYAEDFFTVVDRDQL